MQRMPLFQVYSRAWSLDGKAPVGNGDCVPLVQHYMPHIGPTSSWSPGLRVMDTVHLPVGTVIATFENGRYLNKKKGNHACFFLEYGPTSQTTGKPMFIRVMDQWIGRKEGMIKWREIYPLGKSYAQGNPQYDSNNADTFYIVW
jgi:hypothetical protein